jgi:FkbM family methyltransferase
MKKSFEIIQTQFGNFLVNEFDLIGNFILKTGTWEPHLYEFYSQILKSDDVCVDAGANLGFHAVQFGKLSKKVYAFEPQPIIFNQLCSNILFNNLDNVIIPYRLAIGDKKDTKQMWDIEHEGWVGNGAYNWGGRGIEHKDAPFNSDEVREQDIVEVVDLDSFGIPHCELFKIDIQGYEYYAFLGAKELITTYKPVILLENDTKRTDGLEQKVLKLLKEIGYHIYRYYQSNNEDCILIHPDSNKYSEALDIINSIKNKYNIKQES